MDKLCGKCNELSNENETVRCVSCKAEFHKQCTSLDLSKKVTRQTKYRCDKCTENTSVNSNSDSEDNEGKSSIMQAIANLKSDLYETIGMKLQVLENTISEKLNSKLTSIEQSISNLDNTMGGAIKSLETENENRREECINLKNQCNNLAQEVDSLKSQILDLQQYSRLQNLEISGIPTTNNENIFMILESTCKALDIPWNRSDISAAHRLGGTSSNGRPPNIVVRFVSRLVRASWFEASKKKKNLNAVHISSSFKPSPIYINEHLTSYTKALLSQARSMVRNHQLAFAWIKEGRVLVKAKADGRARRVWNFEDLATTEGSGPGTGVTGLRHGGSGGGNREKRDT